MKRIGTTRLFLSTIALLLAIAAAPGSARAQGISSGCSSLNAGNFDHMLTAGSSGTTISGSLFFNAGDVISVTIANAANSLFLVSLATIFSGETGTLTRQLAITVAGLYNLQSDLVAIGSSNATLTARCTPNATSTTSTSTSTTGQDSQAGTDAGLDAVDTARPGTAPTDLPSRFNPPPKQLNDTQIGLLARRNVLRRQFDDAVQELAQIYQTVLGVDPDNFQLSLVEAAFFDAARQGDDAATEDRLQAVITVSGQLILDAVNDGFQPPAGTTTAQSLAALDRQVALYVRLGEIAKELAQVEARIAAQPGLQEFAATNRGAAAPLSFAGSDGNTLRFSTRGGELGDGRTWIWTQGQIGLMTGSSSRDGHLAAFRLGAVHAISAGTDVGAYLSYLTAQTSQTGPNTTLNTEGLGFGAYVKFDLGNEMSGGLSGFYERSSNDTSVSGATASFNRDYYTLEAELSRAYTSGPWVIIPTARIGVARSARDGYTDSAGTVVAASSETYGTGAAHVNISQSFTPDSEKIQQITLSGDLGIGFNFENRPDRVFSSGTTLSTGEVTGSVSGGATLLFQDGSNLDLRLGASGIGAHSQSVFAAFNYRFEF